MIQDLQEHFYKIHKDTPRVHVWWDVPYRHDAEIVEKGILVVNTSSARMGEGVGDNTYSCATCGEALDPGDLEIDYT